MKKLPVGADVLPASTRLKYWFLTNREPLGKIILSISVIVAGAAFANHAQVAAILSSIAAIVGGSVASAGAFKSDEHHSEALTRELYFAGQRNKR